MKLNFKNALQALMGKSGTAASWLRGDEASDGGAVLRSSYQQSVWVYSCISVISRQVAQIPFRISRGERNGEDILEEGKLFDLLQRPHPQLNRFQFWELWVTWLMLRGESFIVPYYAGNGRARARRAVVLCPDQFQHVVDGTELVGWRYTGNGPDAPLESQVFLPEEVIHSRFPNPYSFWRGAGPNNVALLAAGTDFASAQFMKGLMLNNADTGVIAYTDQQPSEEQRAAILAALRERKRKAGTADRPLILWGGFKIEKPGISSADMQFLENRKFNRQEICAVFGVPQELLGFTEDANRSVGDAARLNFVENRIAPLCEMLESDLKPLVDEYEADGEKLFGWFDIETLPVMQKARRERIDSAEKLFGMGVPLNSINEILDLGLPDLPHGEKAYLPFNLQEVGAAKKPEKPAKPQQEPNDPAGKGFAILEKMMRSAEANIHVCGSRSDEYAAAITGSIKVKTGKLKKFFFEQRSRVLANLSKLNKDFKPETKAFEDVFNEGAENADLLSRLKPLLVGDLEFGGAQLFAEIGMTDFTLPPSEAIEFLNLRENKITGVNGETFQQLKETWQEALSKGETMDQIIDRTKKVFNEASDFRAETIAVTETNTAVNGGRFTGMKQAKVEKKGWQASNLENVRASHLRAEQDYAKGIPLNKKFRVGGYDLMYPGDPTGPAQEVINCRCFTFAVIGEKAMMPEKFLSFEQFTGRHQHAHD